MTSSSEKKSPPQKKQQTKVKNATTTSNVKKKAPPRPPHSSLKVSRTSSTTSQQDDSPPAPSTPASSFQNKKGNAETSTGGRKKKNINNNTNIIQPPESKNTTSSQTTSITKRSPAEFFAEHQAIAGFDNLGKSLYTSIRELIENSLDACEKIMILPHISIPIQEYTQNQFNELFLVRNDNNNYTNSMNTDKSSSASNSTTSKKKTTKQHDEEAKEDLRLFQSNKKKNSSSSATTSTSTTTSSSTGRKRQRPTEDDKREEEEEEYTPNTTKKKVQRTNTSSSPKKSKKSFSIVSTTASSSGSKGNHEKIMETQYFHIIVQDNGCGIQHEMIPILLGSVLSGTKYGVCQTRGKFGLGVKMALIWSKKSTGQPIRIISAYQQPSTTSSTTASSMSQQQQQQVVIPSSPPSPPNTYSTCYLDIDIYKNEPHILEHEQLPNTMGHTGTRIEIVIAGNWTTYKSRILQYLQQLAIITPYAILELQYTHSSDKKKNISTRYERRSEQMPLPARIVKHHPSSVNNITIHQLIQITKTKTLVQFLSKELTAISPAMAKRLIAELVITTANDNNYQHETACIIQESMNPKTMTNTQITRLVQLLRQVQLFKQPDGSCLSPLGEYNLNLGIRKVLAPEYIATARDKPGAYEGHPFLVEAAVSLGGEARGMKNNTKNNNNSNKESSNKEDESVGGITIFRFANRIPLLFEGGADVVTRVAMTKINWSNYKIDSKRDRVGVFVSIVSTKIPFKGTSKEYIGNDTTEIQQSIKRTIQLCCQQLRTYLLKRNALSDAKERKSRLVKYIPDVSRALFGLLDGMSQRQQQQPQVPSQVDAAIGSTNTTTLIDNSKETQTPKASNLLATVGAASMPSKRFHHNADTVQDIVLGLNRGEVTIRRIEKALEDAVDEQQRAMKGGTVSFETPSSDGNPFSEQDGETMLPLNSKGERRPVFIVPLYNLDDSQNDIVGQYFVFRPVQPFQQIELSSESEKIPKISY